MIPRTAEHAAVRLEERFGGDHRIWQENVGPGWELVPGKLAETLAEDE